jgi:hypothetical protein
MTKTILVIAKNTKVEALRVAVGLVLLDDKVKLDVVGELENSAQIQEQLEVLDFADVPYEILNDHAKLIDNLSRDLISSDVVYLL